jgi:hypothetical protein
VTQPTTSYVVDFECTLEFSEVQGFLRTTTLKIGRHRLQLGNSGVYSIAASSRVQILCSDAATSFSSASLIVKPRKLRLMGVSCIPVAYE